MDGTLDRNGYSKDTVTVSARLGARRGGGAPLQIEVSGSRTNLSEVINQLADKVRESLKLTITSRAVERGGRSLQKYYEEAKWALKWGMIDEAQSASESAWALGGTGFG